MTLKSLAPATALLTMLAASPAAAGPIVLTCGPGQRAVVRESFVRGAPVTRATCIETRASRAVVYPARYRVHSRHRSWGKTALTIAGGAGTGAGIGGIVNGRKGALIGAAIGGGAASLFEGAKRR